MAVSDTYQGNRNLKKSNVAIAWTQEQVQEYLKCARDPEYFITTYIRIVNVDLGLIPFHLYDFQKDMVKTAVENRFVICKMPRQVGKTTTVAALLLWYVLFHEMFSIALLANKEAQAIEILSRIQLAYEHLPKWLQQGVVEWNKKSVELENGSSIIASSTSSSAIRGTSQNLVYLDEFAFVPNNLQESFFASVYPTISSGKTTKVLITSTPNGLNQFYRIWANSEQNKNDYKRVDVHWSQVPGRDEKWKEETIRNTSTEQFRVEYECEFVGSTDTLIAAAKLSQLVYLDPVNEREHMKIYEEPVQGKSYIITVDTARGGGNDYSAFQVIDISTTPYKQVGRYMNNTVPVMLYPTIIHQTARYYNNALVLVETNDIGGQVADMLVHDLEYEGVLKTISNNNNIVELSSGFAPGSKLGLRTTKATKRVGCMNLKNLVESDKLIINDYDTIDELMRFSFNGQSYEAEEGHDDLTMGLVLFAWLATQTYFKEISNSDIRRDLFTENIRRIEEEMLPFGIIEDGNVVDRPSLEVVDLGRMSFDKWMLN
jgi:hypothetical protein